MLAKFKEILELRANSSDNTLRKHLDAGNRNAMYTSKTTQNIFWNVWFLQTTVWIPTDHCLESKSMKWQILQTNVLCTPLPLP